MTDVDDSAASTGGEYGARWDRCGRTDVDARWLWLEVQRAAEDEDGEFETVELAFCSQEHAGLFLQESAIDWQRDEDVGAVGVRVDRYFLGCGLVAIVLCVIGLVALIQWVF